jgi:hypothetical protein
MGDRLNAANNMDSDDNDDDDEIMVGDVEAESHDEYDDEEDDEEDDDEESEESWIDIENVETFIRTFHNGDYDQEFDTGLSIDRSVTLPVRPTQTLYNKPDNWRERNQIGLEKIKRQLQNCITSATDDQSFELELRHYRHGWGHQPLMDNEEPIVWHEPIFDEYWNQLEAEIDLRKIDLRKQKEIISDIRDIHIENVEIKKERLAALVAIFCSGRATNSSVNVKFINANLCGEGIIFLSKLIEVCTKLQYFYLYHNRIDNMESARCLSRSLRSHACIDQLTITHCELGSSPEILSVILQSNVKSINLDNNNIDSLGAVKIAEYLEGDPPIHRIDIDHNRLNDDDAILISQALKRNTNMRHLHLTGNTFTSIGVKELLTCVFDGSSLNGISESNHILNLMHVFLCHNLQNCINRLLWMDRIEKILLALNDKESLLPMS